MGLIVTVYRADNRDCTNGGVSAQAQALTLVNVEGPFDPDPKAPAARLEPGRLPGHVLILPEGVDRYGSMFGGNFAYSCDGRFHDAVEAITKAASVGAVPIHDRVEG